MNNTYRIFEVIAFVLSFNQRWVLFRSRYFLFIIVGRVFSLFFCLLLLLSFLMKFFFRPHWESTTDVAIILLLFNIQEIKLRFLNKMILRASFQDQEEVRTYWENAIKMFQKKKRLKVLLIWYDSNWRMYLEIIFEII